ncbi:MAG: HYR domain-containing protein, partial [Saprospiraceae bacterium]|nr:HYR domain-containing protein [Saprospiraceae bacterium]
MKSDCTFQNRILAWFFGLLLVLATANLAQAQIPACDPGSGNALTGPVGPPLTGSLNAGCNVVIPNVLPRWTATPNVGGGWVLITVEQAPLAGTLINLPRSASCPGDVIDINVVAVFFYLGMLTDPSDDILCSITDIDEFTIVDGTPPTITPGDVTLQAGPGCTVTAADIIATITNAEVDDNCTNDATLRANIVITAGLPAVLTCPTNNDVFPITVTTEDACGNISAPATFNVTLEDTRRPIPTCPADQTRYFDAFCQYTVEDFRPLVTAVDDCGAPFVLSQRVIAPVPFPNNTFPIITGGGCPSLRTVIVRICAQDCFGNGNLNPPLASSPPNCCTFAVAVYDNTDPTPEPGDCPAPVLLTTDANCEVIIPDFRTSGLFSDNCDPLLDPTTITQTPPPGPFDASAVVCPPLASLDVSFSFTDCNGNGPVELVCPDVIQIQDLLAPSSITCPTPMDTFNMAIDPVTCQYTFATVPADWFDDRAVATDNCDPDPIEHNALATFDCTELGIQPIPVWAEDCSGNVSGILANCDVFIRANPADAGWDNPGPVCMTDLPLDLCTYITGVDCGEWSGDQLTAGRCSAGGGIFNPPAPGAYAVTYTVGDADCHVELTRVIQVEQSFAAPFLINDFGICWCPDELLDLESLLLGSAPEGGVWTISNSPGLAFALLPPAGPGNSHAALYDGGCGVATISYTYVDCSGTSLSDDILVTIRECPKITWAIATDYCQDEPFSLIGQDLRGCSDYNVRMEVEVGPGPNRNDLIGGVPINTSLSTFVHPVFNTQVPAGDYGVVLELTDPLGICPPVIEGRVVRIYQAAPPPSSTAGIVNPGVLCETYAWPLVLNLMDLNDLAGNPLTAENVRWFGGGVTDNGVSGSFTPNDSDGDGFPGPGSYTVCVSVGDQRCEQIYCTTIVIEDHVPGSCTLQSYAACLEPGATITFYDLLQSSAILSGTFTVVGITNNGGFSTNVAVGDEVSGMVYNGGCGVVEILYTIPSCPNDIQCRATIAINEQLHVDLTGPQTYCANDDVSYVLRNNGDAAACGVNGVWSGPGVTDNGNGVTADFNPAAAGEGVHYAVYTIGNTEPVNCQVIDTLEIVVYAASDPSFTIPQNTCEDVSEVILVLDNSDPSVDEGSPDGDSEVYWSGPGVTDYTGDNAGGNFDPSAAGPGYHLICVMTGEGPCMKFACRLIHVHEARNASLVADLARGCYDFQPSGGGPFVDFNLDELLTPTTTPGGTWTQLSGTPIAIRNTAASVAPGCHELQYTVPAAYAGAVGDCAEMSDIVYLLIVEEPKPAFDMAEEACWDGVDGSLSLPMDYTGETFGNAATRTYSWTASLISGAGPVPTFDINTLENPIITIHGAGVFEICLTETLTYGTCGATDAGTSCSQTYCERITIHETNVEVDPNWTRPVPYRFCTTDDCIDLDDLVTGTPGGVFTGTGVSIEGSHPNYQFCPEDAPPGTHVITYTVQNGAGCTAVMSHNVEVYAPVNAFCLENQFALACGTRRLGTSQLYGGFPNASAFYIPVYIESYYTMGTFDLETFLCPGATRGGTWNLISWPANALGGGLTGVVQSNTLVFTDPGCYVVEYRVEAWPGASDGCVDVYNYRLTVGEEPSPKFSLPNEICWAPGVPTISYNIPANYLESLPPHPGTTFYLREYSSSNPAVATVVGGIVTIVGAGTATICMHEHFDNASCTFVECRKDYCQTITVTNTTTATSAEWTGFGPICVDADCVDLDDLVTGTPGGVFSGEGVEVEGSHPDYQFCPEEAGPGTHAVTYTVNSPDGCTNVLTRNIVVAPLANAELVNKQIECIVEPGGVVPLSVLFASNATTPGGTWSFAGTPPAGAVIMGGNLLFTRAGCYCFTYTVSTIPNATGGGCYAQGSACLQISEQPTPNFNMQNEICWSANDPETTFVPHLNSVYYDVPAEREWWLFPVPILSGITIDPVSGIVTVTDPTIPAGGLHFLVCLTETLVTPECGPAPGPNPATPALGEFRCEQGFCQRIVIRDGTLLDASFTISPVNPCLGEEVTLIPNTPGGTFTGNGVTDDGNGDDGTFVANECGIYAVTYVLDDPNGCNNSYTLNIYTDTVAPEINVPGDFTVDCQSPLIPSMDAWASGADAVDNCGVPTITYRIFDRRSGCSPGTGTYVFEFTATDECGNTAVDYANYVVRDITPPVITGGGNLTVECGADVYARVYQWINTNGGAIATDACDGSPYLIWSNNWSGLINNYCGGQTPVTFTVTDRCGNSASVTFTLEVLDRTAPVWNIPPQNVVFECDNSSDPYAQLSGWLRSNGNGIALDSCFTTVNYTNNFNGLSGGCNRNTGSALVTFTAYDVCGNSSTAQATVSVVDRTPPEITSPAKDTVVECDGQGNTREFAVWIANHGGARAIDLCSGVSCGPIPGARAAFVTGTSLPWGGGPLYDDYTTSMNQVFGAGNWDQFNFGAPAATIFSQNYRIIYLDGGDNSANEFNSFVNANRGLIESWVACGGRLFLNAAPNEGGNIDLGFGGVQILFNPNTPPSGTLINSVTASGAILSGPYQPTGTNFTGTYFAHAIVGPPTMTVMIQEAGGANRPVFAQSLWGSGVVMFGGMTPSGWHGPQPNARNLKWNILDRLNRIPLQNDINHLTDGIFVWDTTLMRTEVTCGQNRILTYMFNALDSCGNISNATIAKFIVRDTTPPVWINEPRNLVVECDGLGNVDELNRWLAANGNGVILEDPCNGTVTYEHDLVREYDRCSNTDSVIYRFTARDCSGNTSTREASFIIRDTRPPTIVSPARDTTLDCANLSGNNDAELISWLNQRAGFNTTDECSDIINYSNDYDVNNWVLGCGNTKYVDVTFIATDDCGNVTRDVARFAIVDTEPPAFLNCPPPIVQNAEKDHCDAYVTVPKLVATDNCTQSDSIAITQIYGPNPTQYRFPVGTTILKYEAVDLCGNRDTCTIKVVVNDYWDVPVITCPADLDLENTPGVCGTNNVRDIGPTSVTDVCPHTAVLYAITNEAGDTIKKGINDASGSNFPKGLNKVCYTVQDQPILLITEVTQQLGGAVIGPSTSMPSFSLADVNGDYLEITNFGPSSIDVSCLSVQIFEGGALLGTYTLPNMPGPVLPAGGVLTLKVGSAVVGYPNNPALFFYNMNLPEAAINTPRGYVLNHLGLRNLDAVTTNGYNLTGQGTPAMTAAGWSGISPTNTNRASYYRWCIFDRNIADDWRLAEACEPASIGRMNPILQQYVFPSNGLRTSVQTIAAQKDTCCFNVLVRDVEIPMCATNDTLRPTGSTNTFNGPGCYSVSLSVPANPATKIIDVWVTNLNISATNFANTEATLIAPDGTRVRLWNDGNCNGSTNLVSTRISDLDLVKLSSANCANLASGNNYLPDQPLAVLCPKSAAGIWRLEVENNASAPSSVTVNSWGLTIISQRAYAQGDTTFNNDPGQCGANFMWIHPTVMDNCCMGTVDVEYIPVPTPGCPLHAVPRGGRVDGGTKTTQFFAVGTTRVVYTLTDMSGNTGSCEFSVTIIDAEDPVFTNCPKDYTINLPGGDCFAFLEINPALWADDNCDSVLIEVNPPLNTELGIGSHKIVATATDKAGNSTMCMWTITVVESTPSGNDLSCVDLINFSLGPDCRGVITADELLAGTDYGCKDKYTIKVEDWITGQTHSNVFTTADIGRCFKVTVIDPVTGNSCWSMVCVEYKATPQIDCPDDLTITCNSSLDPSVLGYPSITSCVINYDVHWDDTIQKARDCDTPYAFIIHRTFTVVNELGNSSSCKQVIWVKAFDLNEIEWPRNYDNLDLPALNCDEKIYDKDVTPHILPSPYCVDGYLLDSAYWFATGGDPTIVDPFTRDLSGDRLPMTLGWNCLDGGINEGHPSPYPVYYAQHPNWVPSRSCWGPNQVVMWHGTGAPSLNGIPISVDNKNCNLSIRYDDEVYDICENGYEILRYWKVRNMCLPPKAGVNPVEWIQVIKVLDQEGPKILYPDTVIVGTGPWACTGTWEVPRPWITDNCADSVRYSVRTWTGSAIQQADGSWIIINMKLGVHPVVITAEDACGNKTEKVVKVNVIDNTPPTAVCDRNIVVSISGNQSPGENFGKIFAEDINDGSFDNCQPHIFFKAIRMEHLRGTNNGSNAAQPDDGTNCAGVNGDDNAVLDGNQIYFDDHIKFCCSDVNQRIMVVLRVFDADPGSGPVAPARMNQNGTLFGKFSDCMIEVEVQDKGVPTVVAPPNIVVSCWFWFDVDKLTDPNDPTFGRVVTDLSDRHKVVTTDLVCHNYCVRNDITGYPGYVPGAPASNPPAWNRACDYYWQLFDTAHADRKYELTWGFDGYVLSNCGNTPTISVNDNRECGQGQLTRTVVARGPNNISITQTQTIWVVDCDPFYINRADNCDSEDDITWPGNCTGQATTIA